MAKTMKATVESKAEGKMTMVFDPSHAAGKSRGVLFRCNAHTDKKKQARKKAYRGKLNW